jgi:hypothetical protein
MPAIDDVITAINFLLDKNSDPTQAPVNFPFSEESKKIIPLLKALSLLDLNNITPGKTPFADFNKLDIGNLQAGQTPFADLNQAKTDLGKLDINNVSGTPFADLAAIKSLFPQVGVSKSGLKSASALDKLLRLRIR